MLNYGKHNLRYIDQSVENMKKGFAYFPLSVNEFEKKFLNFNPIQILNKILTFICQFTYFVNNLYGLSQHIFLHVRPVV